MAEPVALYRKYRSKTLDELVGQEHITKALKNAIKNDRISHAYLFTGPRGVGKTSVARIIAHEVNGLSYENTGNVHLDIIEIDAASNRRIDEVRDLREKVNIAPTSAKYKVYIIDEVHMLTKEAFNALLKVLEEPPEHAIFILATTEAHKVPQTISSRTQKFGFQPIALNHLKNHLSHIAKKEGIKISDDALELIAQHADGSFRDGISLLDQISNLYSGQITADSTREMLGLLPESQLEQITKRLAGGQLKELFQDLEEYYGAGASAQQLADQLAVYWRDLIKNTDFSILKLNELIEGIDRMLAVGSSQNPEAKLEATLALLCSAESTVNKVTKSNTGVSEKSKDSTIKESITKAAPSKATQSKESKKSDKTTGRDKMPLANAIDEQSWNKVLDAVRKTNNSLYAVLRLAGREYEPDSGKLTLIFKFPFHKKRVEQASNISVLKDALKNSLNSDIEIVCTVDPGKKQVNLAKDDTNGSDYETVIDVLGGEVVSI